MISILMIGNRAASNTSSLPRMARTTPNRARSISGKLGKCRQATDKGGYENDRRVQSGKPIRDQILGHRVSPRAQADADGADLSTARRRAVSRAARSARRRLE